MVNTHKKTRTNKSNHTSNKNKSKNRTHKNTKTSKYKKTICVGKIFAEWCGHCKTLEPEWDNMKKMIKKNKKGLKNIKFDFCEIGDTEQNKMNGQTVDSLLIETNKYYFPNQEQNVEIQGGFPTLFKICGKNLEYYSGSRTTKEMYKWYTTDCSKPKPQYVSESLF